MRGIAIGRIPAESFYDYRLEQIFEGYKWDYQSGVQSTISDEVVLLDEANYSFLVKNAEKLYGETIALEAALKENKPLLLELGFSEKLVELISSSNYDPSRHIRLMRFDFHPTTKGWQVSEVNADVPAGFQESSLHPIIAAKYFEGYEPTGHFGNSLLNELNNLISVDFPSVEEHQRCVSKPRKYSPVKVAYIYDSHTVEDSQLLRFLGDYLQQYGYEQLHLEPNQLVWEGNSAKSVSAIVRHYPAEWLEFLPETNLEAYFNSETLSANHPVAVITQSKRLPLVWDKVATDKSTWKALLPKTSAVDGKITKNAIYKPAFGRVGEGINIPGAVSKQEDAEIRKAALANRGQWVQQLLFQSLPIGGLHLAIGVFVINGKFAGCFARASHNPIMNFIAKELPVLVTTNCHSARSRRIQETH